MRTSAFLPVVAALLLVTACTQQEQQQATDTLTGDSASSAIVFDLSDSSAGGETMMDDEKMMNDEKTSDTMMQDDTQTNGTVETKAKYVTYTPSALEDGKTKVLFFHAGWCPFCKTADATLQAWYGSDADVPALTLYKTDYDTETALKAKYGVTYQHTFVKIDGQGNMLSKIQSPTDEQMKAFLGA